MSLEKAFEILGPLVGGEESLRVSYESVINLLNFAKGSTKRVSDRVAINKAISIFKRALIERAMQAETLPDEQIKALRAGCVEPDKD